MLLKSCDTVQTEAEAKAILEPLVESGNSIYQEIMAHSAEVAPADIAAIANPTDQQLAQLAVTYLAAYSPGVTGQKILDCLTAALGYYAIKEIFNIGAIITVETAVALLKVLVQRYGVGYIGLFLAIYSFVHCIGIDTV
ncbi:MAG: hypothetical protein NTV01_11285 [Bacteroidia bacterium]|nr:hypothetical protein [Bacteroidia bacterium]